ncbi:MULTISPECIES: hypothetical protein [Carboxydocella]|nr:MULTISPECIES: hypothetical protein [Carboxydocella]
MEAGARAVRRIPRELAAERLTGGVGWPGATVTCTRSGRFMPASWVVPRV